MQFCTEHWNKMRAAVDARGLTPLVSQGEASAVAKMVDQLKEGEQTLDSFDPLMSMHWAIAGNAMEALKRAGADPLYLMMDGPEDPVDADQAGERFRGRTWPRCPLCYINLAHEITCTDPKCGLDKVSGYDFYIDCAADDAKKFVDDQMQSNPNPPSTSD